MSLQVKNNILKFIFVFVQFGGIVLFLVSGPLWAWPFYLLAIEFSGITLGCWAVLSMKPDNLNIFPDLKTNARLVKKGPYKLIRHPMYLTIVLTLSPLLITEFSLLRLFIFVVLLIDLILKLNYEEKLLKTAFTDYQEYQKKTYRLIPFIY